MSDKSPEKLQDGNDLKKLEQEITKVNPTIFKGLSEPKKTELLKFFSLTISHSGPLPSPETLQKYDGIIKDGAERIMVMAEKQQAHRMNLESMSVSEQLSQSKRGQIFGLIIGLVAILAGTACILMGYEWPGAVIGGGGITGLVSVFVIGKSRQSKSLADKQK